MTAYTRCFRFSSICFVFGIVLGLSPALHAAPFSYLNSNGLYVSSTVSVSQTMDTDFNPTGSASGELDFNQNAGITAAIGHHFLNSWRLELEYAYREFDIERANAPGFTGGGDITNHLLMLNAIYDVNLNYHFFWYAGAGIGFSFTQGDFGSSGVDDSDVVFAHQALTGFGYRLSKQVSLLMGYRLLHTFEQEYESGGNEVEVDGPWSHIFEIGVKYEF